MIRGSSETPWRHRAVASLVVACLLTSPLAHGNPQGGAVRHGQAQIQQSHGQIRIHQQSQRAVIDWESFSIERGETTRFLQPNASSAVLNRVRGNSASQIEGMLRANGKVYLINPNGILVGPSGSIDVGGFVASTLDTDDHDFMRGGDLRFAGASDAAIVNLGSISALDGDVILMAASVNNAGTVLAPHGTAALAAGNDILLSEKGEERVFVRGAGGSQKSEGVTNTGRIEANIAELKAHGGNVYGIAVKNEGRVAATGVTRSGGQIFLSAGGGKMRSTGTLKAKRSEGSGGKIRIDSGETGRTEVGGTVDTSGTTGAGGEIVILGREIEVLDGTLILNDGATLGGQTFVGGGNRGQDPSFTNAETLTVGHGTLISAEATVSGDGGHVVLFATGTTTVNGRVSARGGLAGGHGGFIELSGQDQLFVGDLVGQIDLSSASGDSGTLLLDPTNLQIYHGTTPGIMGNTISDGALMDVLASFPVLLETSELGGTDPGDITFAPDVNLTWSSPHGLSFVADRDIIFTAGAVIHATGSGLFSATAARTLIVGPGASITTTNGNLTLSAHASGTIAGDFFGIDVNGGLVRSLGTGSVSVTGRGGNGSSVNQWGVGVRNGGDVLGGTGGTVTVTGTGGQGSSGQDAGIVVTGTGSSISSLGGNVSLVGQGGGTNNFNHGVWLYNGGLVSAGSGGNVSVTGTGGSSPTESNFGILMESGAMISSGGGLVSVTGTGGGAGTGSTLRGVALDAATITAGGTGSVTVIGNANTSGPSLSKIGVALQSTAQITSAGGTVNVTGTGGFSAGSGLGQGSGIRLLGDSLITAGGSGAVNVNGTGGPGATASHEGIFVDGGGLGSSLARIGAANGTTAVVATAGNGTSHALSIGTGSGGRLSTGNLLLIYTDSLDLGANGTISSGTSPMHLIPRSLPTRIDLGGTDVLNGTPLTLGLSDAELDRITAGTLQIGNGNSAGLTVSAAITQGNHLTLTSAGQVTFLAPVTMAADRTLLVSAVGLSSGGIILASPTADLSASGTGSIALTSARDLSLTTGSSVTSQSGSITFSANANGLAAGNFSGITLSGATVATTGGNLTLTGGGGDDSASGSHVGLVVSDGSVLSTLSSGTLTLTGRGGIGNGDNHGISISDPGTEVRTQGGDLIVNGDGDAAATGDNNDGITVSDGALITSLTGDLSFDGVAGGGTAGRNGVAFLSAGTLIRADSGNLQIGGTGGGSNELSNFGIAVLLEAAIESGSGAGGIFLSGIGGTGGVYLSGDSTISSTGSAIELTGTALAGNHAGIQIDLASLSSASATLHLKGTGSGSGPAISSTLPGVQLGGANATVILESLGGDVSVSSQVLAHRLQFRDSTGLQSVDFSLTHTNNDADLISALSTGSQGAIGSLDFRDRDGVTVEQYLGGDGILTTGDLKIEAGAIGREALVIGRQLRSLGGDIDLDGYDLVVDGATISTLGSGTLELDSDRAMLLQNDASLSVVDGDLALRAHLGTVSEPGQFTGLTLLSATVSSSGSGSLHLSGKGGYGTASPDFTYSGFTNPSSNGIRLDEGAFLSTTGSGGITLEGTGGTGLSGSNGLLLEGVDTLIETNTGDIELLGYGRGLAGGAGNRGIHLLGATIGAGGSGDVTVTGIGGLGATQIDGVEIGNGASLRVENGDLSLSGTAGGSLGIGFHTTATGGDLGTTGTGSVTIFGSGVNAAGVSLLNGSALLGGTGASSVVVSASSGELHLGRNATSAGDVSFTALSDEVIIGGTVVSGTGDVSVTALDLTIDAALSAPAGDITLRFGDPFAYLPVIRTARINAALNAGGDLSFIGGAGILDTLTFAGYGAAVDLDYEDLTAIESVVGGALPGDHLRGPDASSLYQFAGANAFQVGGVAFTSFENVSGGLEDDVFAFTGNASIQGALDGGGGADELDYTLYGTGVIVDLLNGAATGIIGGFQNIATFSGSGNIDTVTGPGSASVYQFFGPDSLTVGAVSITGFENLIAGPLADRFVFQPGARISGYIDGGDSPTPAVDTFDYSLFAAPVTIDLGRLPRASATGVTGGFTGIEDFIGSGLGTDHFIGSALPARYDITGRNTFNTGRHRATGFENLTGGSGPDTFAMGPGSSLGGRLSGGNGTATDVLTYADFDRPVTVRIGSGTATALAGGFTGIETLVGSSGNDTFLFQNQATIPLVDGGPGSDRLDLNDANLRGDHTYTIGENSISRNPFYGFQNFETVRLFLGPGDNTVNSGFYDFTQVIQGGEGYDRLLLPGVTSLNGPNPIQNVHHFAIDAPRPTESDLGDLLQSEVDPHLGNRPDPGNFATENRFTLVDPATLTLQVGQLSGAFSAAVVAQASVIALDGNNYLILRPFSLDGSGLTPSNLAVGQLQDHLDVDANLELAAAIGYTGSIFLFNPDGPYALDLSGAPVDPAVLSALREALSVAAATELSAALGLVLLVAITEGDGVISIALDGVVAEPSTSLILAGHLDDAAAAELNSALGEN